MKILTVLGARPQFVKAAVISRELASYTNSKGRQNMKEVIVHTGQHYDSNMSDIFFSEMLIPKPDYNLGIHDGPHGAMTGRMLEQIEAVIMKEKPDVTLVYGDTNSTLAGALASAKVHIPVAHVEAGLRSYNMNMPEEINRIMTDHISTWLFCPTETAVNNLRREGKGHNDGILPKAPVIAKVGDVMHDATLFYRKLARPGVLVKNIIDNIRDGFYLATIHREENTDSPERLKNIVGAFETIVKKTPVVLPLHPRTKKALLKNGMKMRGVTLIDPVGYFDMLLLLEHCRAVFTDSGGLQKEAYFFRKPCITLRDETEWVELVDHGFNTLAGAKTGPIIEAEKNAGRKVVDDSDNLYGQGDAGVKIVRTLADQLG